MSRNAHIYAGWQWQIAHYKGLLQSQSIFHEDPSSFSFHLFEAPHPFSWHVQHSFWKKKFYFCRPTSIIIADKAARREKWKVRANKVLWRVWRTEGLTGEERSCLWLSCFLFCLPSHEVVEILGLNKVFGIPWGEEELASSCHGTKTRSHIIVSISSNSRFGTI